MCDDVRMLRPQREQVYLDVVDLDSQLPPDHPARLVWLFVERQDLGAARARIKSRVGGPGRPAADPAVLLALWLYATLDGVGSARAIERLCEHHAAYRWIAGGVPANHDMLSQFRRDGADWLDAMLTRSLGLLIADGLLSLDEVAIDGTKTRALAGPGSLAGRRKLERVRDQVAAHIARLRQELDLDPAEAGRRRQERQLQAAQRRADRIAQAERRMRQFEAEQAERAKRDKRDAKRKPKVSLSDPEVRRMRLPDGATAPAWNVQVATSAGFVLAIEPTERRNDSGLAPEVVAQIVRRCGRAPTRLLADQTAMRIEDIATLAGMAPDLQVYSPVPEPRAGSGEAAARARARQRQREPEAVTRWRQRMASEQGPLVYARRKLTEWTHAMMKNRGFGRMPVHGRHKVRVVCLLHALAHNLVHAHAKRTAASA